MPSLHRCGLTSCRACRADAIVRFMRHGCDCAGDSLYAESAAPINGPAPGPGWMYRPEAGIGFEPVQFQRLGQIPNDLAVGTEPPAGAPQPLDATAGMMQAVAAPATAHSAANFQRPLDCRALRCE